jgi:hypothetical protein
MATPQKLGFDDVSKQDLFAMYSETPDDLPDTFGLSSPRFICFLAWDSQDVDVDKITEVATKVLNAGAVYVCTWGRGCKRVHDIIDQLGWGANPSEPVDRVIMTTWHDEDTLAEAIWFVLRCTLPEADYQTGCNSTLAISIGNSGWHDEICRAFSDPEGFSR